MGVVGREGAWQAPKPKAEIRGPKEGRSPKGERGREGVSGAWSQRGEGSRGLRTNGETCLQEAQETQEVWKDGRLLVTGIALPERVALHRFVA